MNQRTVLRDERTELVENASYRLAYQIIAFGALIVVAYRGFLFQESLWDLLALVILSSGVATLYQGVKKIFVRNWLWLAAAVFIGSAILAAILVFLLR